MKSTKIVIKIATWEVAKGHTPHRSGNGVHGDRRLKRQKTRSNQLREALK